jgi:hypothetical protein
MFQLFLISLFSFLLKCQKYPHFFFFRINKVNIKKKKKKVKFLVTHGHGWQWLSPRIFLFLNFHFVFSKRNEVIWDIVTKKIGEIIKGLKYNILTL